MDDFTKIDRLLTPDHQLSAAVVSRSRVQLLDEIKRSHASSGETILSGSRGRTFMLHRINRRFAITGATLLAVAASSFGFYAWQTRPLYKAEPLAGQGGPASSFLLASADGLSLRNTGRYWYLHTATGQTYLVSSRVQDGRRYSVAVEGDSFLLSENGSRPRATITSWFGDRASVKPASPADRAAWTADRQPSAFDLGIEAPGIQRGPQGTEGAELDIGANDAAKLPTDPARLRAWILNYASKFDHKKLKNPDLYLFIHAPTLLADLPTSDRVRIATYRILASLRGVHLIDATDADGLKLKAVTMRQAGREYGTLDWQLFVDSSTGRFLGSQAIVIKGGTKNSNLPPGSRQFYELVKQAQWVNAKPVNYPS